MLRRHLLLLGYGVSGAAALVYEVTWTRLLALEMGHGIAAASTVLAAFMGGLAVGSAVGGHFGGRLTQPALFASMLSSKLSLPFSRSCCRSNSSAVRPWLATAYADGNPGIMFPLLRLVSSLFLLAVPAAAMGATFPIASRWVCGAPLARQRMQDGCTPSTRSAPPSGRSSPVSCCCRRLDSGTPCG